MKQARLRGQRSPKRDRYPEVHRARGEGAVVPALEGIEHPPVACGSNTVDE
jgi:hypothetical protein